MPVSGFASEKWKFKPILLLLLFFFSQRGRPLLVVIGDIESEVVGHLMTDCLYQAGLIRVFLLSLLMVDDFNF